MNHREGILETRQLWAVEYPEVEFLPLPHVPGEEIIADLGTGSTATPEDVGLGSSWQLGLPESSWPMSSKVSESTIREEEVFPRPVQVNNVRDYVLSDIPVCVGV